MKYQNIVKGVFLSRPNRFIAHVEIDGKLEIAHVKNTGRCRELLVPFATIYLEHHDQNQDHNKRKTKYSLIAVEKGSLLINMDSQVPNKVLHEALLTGILLPNTENKIINIKREAQYGNSRLDFYLETEKEKIYLEVKGVTLEEGGIASFPDAPTERGVKHIGELIKAMDEGFSSYIVFIIQMKGIKSFTPNDKTHLEFGNSLRKAKARGVTIVAYDCFVAPDEIKLADLVEVEL